MAEPENVSRDQHRADLAELRLEVKEELHGIRQDVAVLAKTVEALGSEMRHGFESVSRDLAAGRAEGSREVESLRRDTDAGRAESSREVEGLRRDTDAWRRDLRQDLQDLRAEMRAFRTTTQRQLWTMIGVITAAVLSGVIKLVLLP